MLSRGGYRRVTVSENAQTIDGFKVWRIRQEVLTNAESDLGSPTAELTWLLSQMPTFGPSAQVKSARSAFPVRVTVDLAHHRVNVNGQVMDALTYKEMELLFILLRRSPRVVRRKVESADMDGELFSADLAREPQRAFAKPGGELALAVAHA